MPKEFTHFLIAHKALDMTAVTNADAARCIKENYNLFMLGAILCDSPYYHLPFSGGKQELLELSKNIHSPCGEIYSDFFQRLTEAVARENDEAYFAFLCGVLSHHITDRNFHPFIFYFTGKYEDPSRHRFLESIIDLRLMNTIEGEKICPTSVDNYLSIKKTEMLPFLKMFAGAATSSTIESETTGITKRLWKALCFEILLSRLYCNKRMTKALMRINNLLKGRLSPFVTLFYPEEHSCDLPLLDSGFRDCDPFSDEERKASVESIAEKTATQLSSAITLAYENFKGSKPIFDKETMDKMFCKKDCKTFEFKDCNTEAIDDAMKSFLGIRQ